jgi:hypothetical protein
MIMLRQRMMEESVRPVGRLRQDRRRVLVIKHQMKLTAAKTLTSGRSRSGGRSMTRP